MVDSTSDQDKKPEDRVLPFTSQIKGLKEKISQVTEDKKMGADLLFLNTYMASLAIANASRPEIFAYASNRKE
jgi:flagellar protein FlaJ